MTTGTTVGFIGLGAMGTGMAQTLLEAGHAVQGFDVRQEAVDALAAAGGRGVDSVQDAAREVDVLLVMVLSAEQVTQVLFGQNENGVDAAGVLPSDAVVMQCATVTPAFARETAARLSERGLLMLDAPVSGGTVGADGGSLTVMASGPDAAFTRAQPVLDAIADNVFNLGAECGLGSTMKMINQLLAGVQLAAAAEAMAFAEKAGLEAQQVYDIITVSAGNSWMFENRVPHLLADDYTPHSAVDIWLKDLGIVLETGRAEKFPLPLAAAAIQQFVAASAQGWGRLDDMAVVKIYERMGGK